MKGQQILFSKQSDEWSTPQDLFDTLNDEFNFTLDPCATDGNHKVSKYFTIETDGLKQSWSDESVFINPPHSKVKDWVEKAYVEHTVNKTTVVMLLPGRTDTKWFHTYIWDSEQNKPYPDVSIRFLKGRLKFGDSKNSAPFPSMLVIFR